ncbi:MAG TPA: glycosyltransferase family 2 protein [Acidimicrobiia bacterium]|nr:glycosyltransferase family 2 protein [Acidimicrobiia bacterium]
MVIPVRAARGHLQRALESIAAQTYPEIIEVVVADADGSAEGLESDHVRIVTNPSGTTPAGLNLAIAHSRGDVIARCDAHAVLPPGYVSRALETMQRTGADNVGGMQIPMGEGPWGRAIATAMASPWGAGDARYRIGGVAGPAETVYLGVFRRSALERVGGFDEGFARTQDYELNHRIIATGGVVWFDPELKVEYRPRLSLGDLARQYLDYGRAKRAFARKHRGALRWRQLAPPALVLLLALTTIGSIWWPWLLGVPALYAVALMVVGITSTAPPFRLAAALATMHLAWGCGFLTGAERR